MDAIIGRYRVHAETASIVLQHPTGISFDLKPAEALAFADLINMYRETLTELEPFTDPALSAISERYRSEPSLPPTNGRGPH